MGMSMHEHERNLKRIKDYESSEFVDGIGAVMVCAVALLAVTGLAMWLVWSVK